jgi:guanylate kinase
MLFVISAPSGAGKTTIIKELFKENPDIKFSVSATTRPKRAGEQDGIDYYFLSDKDFDEKIAFGEFVEWEYVHGNRYGTLKSEILKYIKSTHNLVFDVDVKGALSIKKIYPEAVLVFIDVPRELLLSRLKNRKTETDEQIKKRGERIEMEIKEKDKFDYIVENSEGSGGLTKAVNELNKIIKNINNGVK